MQRIITSQLFLDLFSVTLALTLKTSTGLLSHTFYTLQYYFCEVLNMQGLIVESANKGMSILATPRSSVKLKFSAMLQPFSCSKTSEAKDCFYL